MFKKKDYDKIIDSHRQELIDSFVAQYGEQYRDLITDRVNKTKYCFFITPETPITTQVMGLHYYHLYAVELLDKLGIKGISCNQYSIYAESPEFLEEAKILLNLLYSSDIRTFTAGSSASLSVDMFAKFKHLKKEDFSEGTIKYLEQKTGKSIDEIIKLANHYSRKAKSLHVVDDTFRYDNEIQRIINSGNINELILNDFNIDEYENRDRIKDVLIHNFLLGACGPELKKTGEYETVVYLSPYLRDYGCVDVYLDHETRHAIETSTPVGDKYKCGLEYHYFSDKSVPRNKPTIMNEIMTQKMSEESTFSRQDKGIFILQDKNVVDKRPLCGYDRLISTFDLLVSPDLYRELVDARLKPTIPEYLQGEIERIDKGLIEAERTIAQRR